MDWTKEEAFEFLAKKPRIGRLATSSTSGEPYVSPVWFKVEGERLLVHTFPTARKTKNISTRGRFAMTVDTDEWPYRGVILRGSARIAEEGEVDLHSFLEDVATSYLGPGPGGAMARHMGRMADQTILVLEPETWHGMDYS